MRLDFYDKNDLKRFYELQDYVIKNIESYLKEKNQKTPFNKSSYNREHYFLKLHLKYLKKVKEVLGLDLEKIYKFYTSIAHKKKSYYKSSGITPKIRQEVSKRHGKNACAITGNNTNYICHHRIFYDEEELKSHIDINNIIPIEENIMYDLQESKHILVKYILPLINTFNKYYLKQPKILEYDNVLSYFESQTVAEIIFQPNFHFNYLCS